LEVDAEVAADLQIGNSPVVTAKTISLTRIQPNPRPISTQDSKSTGIHMLRYARFIKLIITEVQETFSLSLQDAVQVKINARNKDLLS
jgi:hypothetical protein